MVLRKENCKAGSLAMRRTMSHVRVMVGHPLRVEIQPMKVRNITLTLRRTIVREWSCRVCHGFGSANVLSSIPLQTKQSTSTTSPI